MNTKLIACILSFLAFLCFLVFFLLEKEILNLVLAFLWLGIAIGNFISYKKDEGK